jgi:hypothetical protein
MFAAVTLWTPAERPEPDVLAALDHAALASVANASMPGSDVLDLLDPYPDRWVPVTDTLTTSILEDR